MTNPYALFRQTPSSSDALEPAAVKRRHAIGAPASPPPIFHPIKRGRRGCLTTNSPPLPSNAWMFNFRGYAGRRNVSAPSRQGQETLTVRAFSVEPSRAKTDARLRNQSFAQLVITDKWVISPTHLLR